MEHRWGRRIAVEIPIQMVAKGISLKSALMANLSVTGALIKADCELRVLSRIQILVESPTRPQKDALILAAYVAGNYRHGIGVEWCEWASPRVTELLQAVTASPWSHTSRDLSRPALPMLGLWRHMA
jgi:hypothetical protein